jgi:quercetin dioxygenase-like cupin family protein
MHVIRTGPESQSPPAERFTGTVWIDPIASAAPPSRLRVARVHFSPSARTAWHRHPLGQILHVLEGRGRVQQRGHPVSDFQAGDTIVTLPGEWHWHGAAPGTFMTHLAIQEADDDCNDVYWGEHVTDDEYRLGSPSGQG